MKIALFILLALFGTVNANAAAIPYLYCSNHTYSFNLRTIVGIVAGPGFLQGTFGTKNKDIEILEMEQMFLPQYTAYPYREVIQSKDGASAKGIKTTLYVTKVKGTEDGYTSQVVREKDGKKSTYNLSCTYMR